MSEPGEISSPAIARFNRRCRWLAALWLIIALPMSLYLRPAYQDFSAFYFAGVAVRTHHWDLLYPQRQANNPYFIFSAFEWKPGQLELADRHQILGLQPFVGLPWNALLFVPLSYFSFIVAHRVWTMILIGCAFGTAHFAGRSYEICAARPSRVTGIITLLSAISVLTYRCVRCGNVSLPTALAIAVATFSLLQRGRRGDFTSAAAIIVGGLLKYATVAVLPVIFFARRWRLLAGILLAGAAVFAMTLALSGFAPFRDFFQTVGASFNGSTPLRANQSIWGFLLRVTSRDRLPAMLIAGGKAAEGIALLTLLWLMFRQPRRAWETGPVIFAATSALICWMLIFSPVFWEHYAIYLQPFWGWMIWEAKSAWKKFAAIGAIALAWVPLPGLYTLHLPEPLNSMLLWSCCLMLLLAAARLVHRTTATVAAQ